MSEIQWYCIKTRPRQERTAKLAILGGDCVEVFCPLLRFERARKSGKVRVTEAMFPGYLFARFEYAEQHRQVSSVNGVSKIVAFGGLPCIVPDEVISELKAAVSEEETVEIPSEIDVGEEVQVIEGPFQGIRAVVTRVMPSRSRVTLLLELLGMQREIEVAGSAVLPDVRHPLAPR